MLQEPFFFGIKNQFESEKHKRIQQKNKNSFKYQTNDSYNFSNKQEETIAESQLITFLNTIFSDYLVISNPHLEGINEACDALVVFKNHILIFSDKSKSSNNTTLEKTWLNFYQGGIKKSEKQLKNAYLTISKNIKNNILKITNDDKSDSFEIFIPDNPIFHLITTLSEMTLFLKTYPESYIYFNKDNSLPIDHSEKQSNKKILSRVNKFDNAINLLLHSIDIITLKNISVFFNTPLDFINYIVFRENFFIKNISNHFVLRDEKELIALFLIKDYNHSDFLSYFNINLDSEFEQLSFLIDSQNNNISIYNFLLSPNSYFYQLLENSKKSIFIDDLLQYFCYTGNQTNSEIISYNLSDLEYKQSMYKYLSLNRKERISIYLTIEDMIFEIENNNNIGNFTKSFILNDTIYIYCFYIYNSQKHSSLTDYRKKRSLYMNSLINQTLQQSFNPCKIYVFGFDHPISFFKPQEKTNAIDLIYFEN